MTAQLDLFALPLFAVATAPPPPFAKQAAGAAASALLDEASALTRSAFDFARIGGHEVAKRAIEIAVAGGHDLLLIGGDDKYALCAAAGFLAEAAGVPPARFVYEEHRDRPARTDLAVALSPQGEAASWPGDESTAQVAPRCAAARARIARWDAGAAPPVEEPAERLMAQAVAAMGIDLDCQFRVRHVARTIAALAERDSIGRVHIAEALSYVDRPAVRQAGA